MRTEVEDKALKGLKFALSNTNTTIDVIAEDSVVLTVKDPALTKVLSREPQSHKWDIPTRILNRSNGPFINVADYVKNIFGGFNFTTQDAVKLYTHILYLISIKALAESERTDRDIQETYEHVRLQVLKGDYDYSAIEQDMGKNVLHLIGYISGNWFNEQDVIPQLFSWEEARDTFRLKASKKNEKDRAVKFMGTDTTLVTIIRHSRPEDYPCEEQFVETCLKGYNNIIKDIAMMDICARTRGFGDTKAVIDQYKEEMYSKYRRSFDTSLIKLPELIMSTLYRSLVTLDPAISRELFTEQEVYNYTRSIPCNTGVERGRIPVLSGVTHEFTK